MNTVREFRIFRIISEKIRNMPIIPKLATAYILSLVFCIFIVSSFFYYSFKNEMEARSKELAGNMVKQSKTAIENRINLYKNMADMLYLNRSFQDLLFNEYYDSIEAQKAADKILLNLNPISDAVDIATSINIYVTNETIPEYKNIIKRFSEAKDKPWYKKLNDNIDNIVWEVEDAEAADDRAAEGSSRSISLIRNIRHLLISQTPANYMGVLKIDFDTPRFFEGVINFSEKGHSWFELVDEGKEIVYSSAGSKWGKGHGFPIEDMTVKQGSGLVKVNGVKYMMVYETIEPTDWKLLYYINFDDYLRNTNKFRFVSVVIVVCVIIAFMAISWVIATGFTKNIRKLSGFMKEIEKGNFDLHVEETGKDEIGSLISGFNKMTVRLKKLIDEVYRNKLAEKEYELQSLQAQINPHFLYNALSSISWLGLRFNAPGVSDMANALVKFYKNTLCGGLNIITVGQEIEQIKSYLGIQDMRYKNKISAVYHFDQELLKASTIKFILQPFVENSIVHGIYEEKGRVNLRIMVERDGEDLLWRVIDDGGGIGAEKLGKLLQQGSERTSGYGIYNVDRRIKTYYGESYGVSIFSRPGIGTAVSIRIPLKQ